jgi:myo-inositol-1(or 4)-monophosphatase
MKWHAEFELAKVAARKAAGQLAAMVHDQEKVVLNDAGRDIKLQADRDSESVILEILAQSEHPVLAEESGEHGVLADNPYWVVDPLDGTLNFSRGVPLNCVSVALCRRNDALLGVVHDFNRDECYAGIVGEGAWLNHTAMTVSDVCECGKAILATGFPVNRDFGSPALAGFIDQVKRFKKVRLFGSAALSLAYVASGRVDAYAEDDIMFWDVAAGAALVEAAGGYVDVSDSESLKWGKTVRCASSAAIWNNGE